MERMWYQTWSEAKDKEKPGKGRRAHRYQNFVHSEIQVYLDMETGKLPEPHCFGGYVDFRIRLDLLNESEWQ